MNLSKYICDLLFENDKVIIPGLGALISKEISAKIHPIEHSFSPPSKEILFNSNLQKNDDLLIDYISKAENISKTKATKHISDFAENCKSELEKGKLIPFTGIGELQIDTHGEITLIPNKTKNFNLDSFGLSNFISPAIQRRDIQKEPEKDLTEKAKINKHKNLWIWIPAAGVIAIIIAYIIFGMYDYYKFYSILSSHSKKDKTISSQVKVATKSEEKLLEKVTVKPTENISETSNKEIEKDKIQEVVYEAEEKNFFIIAGCFKSLDKAENYVNKLIENGFDASIQGQTQNGLHRVCYEGYVSKQVAEKALKKIRSEGKSGGWIIEIN